MTQKKTLKQQNYLLSNITFVCIDIFANVLKPFTYSLVRCKAERLHMRGRQCC